MCCSAFIPMRSALNSRVQLELLRKLRDQKTLIQKGFTLVELMIVVAIVGILSAVALPSFLGARNSAQAGAFVGEAVGLAKECATHVVSGIGTAPSAAGNIATLTCNSSGGSVVTNPWTAGAVGVKCLSDVSVSADTKATVTVTSAGGMTCAFGT